MAGTDLQPVAFDIETSGLTVKDEVTVVGFELPLGAAVFLNAAGQEGEWEEIESRCSARAGRSVRLRVGDTEAATLDAVASFVSDTLQQRDYYLTGYNAEVWNGGFDFAFLRTRFANGSHEWPFELPFADLYPLFSDRINTRIDEETEARDLEGVHEALIEAPHCDPFEDSLEAVNAWEDGEFTDLLCHNIADIGRTQSLAEYAERYVPKSDFDMKDLSPP